MPHIVANSGNNSSSCAPRDSPHQQHASSLLSLANVTSTQQLLLRSTNNESRDIHNERVSSSSENDAEDEDHRIGSEQREQDSNCGEQNLVTPTHTPMNMKMNMNSIHTNLTSNPTHLPAVVPLLQPSANTVTVTVTVVGSNTTSQTVNVNEGVPSVVQVQHVDSTSMSDGPQSSITSSSSTLGG